MSRPGKEHDPKMFTTVVCVARPTASVDDGAIAMPGDGAYLVHRGGESQANRRKRNRRKPPQLPRLPFETAKTSSPATTVATIAESTIKHPSSTPECQDHHSSYLLDSGTRTHSSTFSTRLANIVMAQAKSQSQKVLPPHLRPRREEAPKRNAQTSPKPFGSRPAVVTGRPTDSEGGIRAKGSWAKSPWISNRDIPKGPKDSDWNIPSESGPVRWASSDDIDSAVADPGLGDGRKKKRAGSKDAADYKLHDWSGGWAPAPIDWDCRPAFRANQSSELVQAWLDATTPHAADQATVERFSQNVTSETAIGHEIAPRCWMHNNNNIEWKSLCDPTTSPAPVDEGDLNGVVPWWHRYANGSSYLQLHEQPEVVGVDPNENERERLRRENDQGAAHHVANQAKLAQAKKAAKRERNRREQEKRAERKTTAETNDGPRSPSGDPLRPGIQIYLRSAMDLDVPEIRDITNYFITNSAAIANIEDKSISEVCQHLQSTRSAALPYIVACERGQVIKCRKQNKGEDIVLPDKVVGFAYAEDLSPTRSIYRFTTHLHIYTRHDCFGKGIGSCLLDKLLDLLDPDYLARGGYQTDGDDMEGIGVQIRVIKQLVINFTYDNPTKLQWTRKWLTKEALGFQEVGQLQDIGYKNGKIVGQSIFQRATGSSIDPASPPV